MTATTYNRRRAERLSRRRTREDLRARVRSGGVCAETIAEARWWISECVWADLDEPADVGNLTDEAVVLGVERHYDGGWAQFARDTLVGAA